MVKIVKNPGNERLNNLNDPVLNVLRWLGANDELDVIRKPNTSSPVFGHLHRRTEE